MTSSEVYNVYLSSDIVVVVLSKFLVNERAPMITVKCYVSDAD
jgi:hypothetical protein